MADLRMAKERWRICEWRMADAEIRIFLLKLKHHELNRNDTPKEFAIRHSQIRHVGLFGQHPLKS